LSSRDIETLLKEVKSGQVSIPDALRILKHLPFQDVGFARIDTHRTLRKGYPEVVFGQGKSPSQVVTILKKMKEIHPLVLVTKVSEEMFQQVKKEIPDAVYHKLAHILRVGKLPGVSKRRRVLVITAGTSDIPIAQEVSVTARAMGCSVDTLWDVGSAGIHRLFASMEKLEKARVIIVVAGMEGALPGIVAGLVSVPVIAVPTSVGYGASFQGLSALLTMLNACASGIAVVNIDNGFGAGYLAALITHS